MRDEAEETVDIVRGESAAACTRPPVLPFT